MLWNLSRLNCWYWNTGNQNENLNRTLANLYAFSWFNGNVNLHNLPDTEETKKPFKYYNENWLQCVFSSITLIRVTRWILRAWLFLGSFFILPGGVLSTRVRFSPFSVLPSFSLFGPFVLRVAGGAAGSLLRKPEQKYVGGGVGLQPAQAGYLSSSLEESESEDSCLDFFSFFEEWVDRPDLVRPLLLPETLH